MVWHAKRNPERGSWPAIAAVARLGGSRAGAGLNPVVSVLAGMLLLMSTAFLAGRPSVFFDTDGYYLMGENLAQVIKSLPLGGKPEECAADGTGKLYVNLEDSSEIIELDAAKPAVLRHASLAPCESPSGLAIDIKNKRLFAACSNKVMAVIDIATLKVLATPPIGPGADGAGFDSGLGQAYTSNGGDGTLSIVKEVGGKYQTVDNVPTEKGARTMTVDSKNHRVYLLAAEYGPAPEAEPGKRARPPILPDSFHIIVVGK